MVQTSSRRMIDGAAVARLAQQRREVAGSVERHVHHDDGVLHARVRSMLAGSTQPSGVQASSMSRSRSSSSRPMGQVVDVAEVAPTDWRALATQLLEANEAVCATARAALDVARRAGDAPSEDLLVRRLQAQQKDVWMLAACLRQ